MKCVRSIQFGAALAWSAFFIFTAPGAGLERVQYQHPGLVVDLGVGLWAWPVPADADGDGDFDLIVSCPDKPYNGIWFFENTTGDTAKNPIPVFKAARRLSQAVHYVTPSYVEGKVRVLSPATEYADFLGVGLAKPIKLPLPATIHTQLVNPKMTRGPRTRHNQWRYSDHDGDGALDLIIAAEDWSDYGWDDAWDGAGKWTNGPLHGFVYLLRNLGSTAQPRYDTARALEAGGKRLDTFGCPSPNFADFDGDGDLDLICGEFLDGFTYFENLGTRGQPRYAAGRRLLHQRQPLTMDLEMIVPVAMDWNKDGHVDLIVGDEDGRVAWMQNTGKLSPSRTPQFLPPHYFQQEAADVKSGALATPVGFDWDGDGDDDILCGNTAGYILFFENLSGPRVEKPKWAAPRRLDADGKTIRIMAGPNGSIQGPAEAKWGYTTLSVADWDDDSLPDLIVNSIWGKVIWYRNTGTRTVPKLAAAQPIEVEWDGGKQPTLAWGWLRPEGKGLLTQWRTTPFAVDWNGDGRMDLVMLDHEGHLAFFERARRGGKPVLLSPRRIFCDDQGKPLRLASGSAGRSGRRKLCVVDWDGDGKLDILLNGENANFLRQVGARDGNFFFKDMGKLAAENVASHDVSPTIVDWNGDGVPDLLAGAEDGHLYYLRNPRGR